MNAKTALLKARYFLDQSKLAEADPKTLDDVNRLPFAANLEAAIIYARSAIDHLKKEFAPAHQSRGYRKWHNDKWKQLDEDPVFKYFSGRRNFIVHQGPEKTSARVYLEANMKIALSASLSLAVIRADGTIEPPVANPLPPSQINEPPASEGHPPCGPKPSSRSQQFFFADANWNEKSAIEYVDEYVAICQQFVSEAESKFHQ
jgi:hypothetical protein